MLAALIQKSTYGALQMLPLCSNYAYQESVSGGEFTLTLIPKSLRKLHNLRLG